MPRAVWKGAISFGMVSVPVEAYPADRSHALGFAMLDKRDFAPVGYRRYNKKSGKEVPWDDVVKGYEYDKDKYVVLTDEDFRRANVHASQTIDIATFVPRDAVPGAFFETPYYLVPDKRGRKAYVLLRDTLAGEDKLAIGQVVMRNRQHLVALDPEGPMLIMNVLRYAGEIRDLEGLDVPPRTAKAAGISAREIELARKLIADMSGQWKPTEFKDTYHADLMKRIEEKIERGETRKLTVPGKEVGEPRSAQVIDLMDALRKSLAGVKKQPAKAGKTTRVRAPAATKAAARRKRA
jgi:DNA end-binding protein Ku